MEENRKEQFTSPEDMAADFFERKGEVSDMVPPFSADDPKNGHGEPKAGAMDGHHVGGPEFRALQKALLELSETRVALQQAQASLAQEKELHLQAQAELERVRREAEDAKFDAEEAQAELERARRTLDEKAKIVEAKLLLDVWGAPLSDIFNLAYGTEKDIRARLQKDAEWLKDQAKNAGIEVLYHPPGSAYDEDRDGPNAILWEAKPPLVGTMRYSSWKMGFLFAKGGLLQETLEEIGYLPENRAYPQTEQSAPDAQSPAESKTHTSEQNTPDVQSPAESKTHTSEQNVPDVQSPAEAKTHTSEQNAPDAQSPAGREQERGFLVYGRDCVIDPAFSSIRFYTNVLGFVYQGDVDLYGNRVYRKTDMRGEFRLGYLYNFKRSNPPYFLRSPESKYYLLESMQFVLNKNGELSFEFCILVPQNSIYFRPTRYKLLLAKIS